MNSIKRQKDRTLKDELPSLVDAQCVTGEEWRNTSWKNEEDEQKWKQCPVVGEIGDGSKVRCCLEQYCIGTWNVRTMDQGKLEVVKQERIKENWKWSNRRESRKIGSGQTGDGKSEHQHFRNQWTKKDQVQNAVNGYNCKNNRMISVYFRSKPFSITVIQAYALTTNVKEAEQFYEDLQDLLELTPKKDILFIIGDWMQK